MILECIICTFNIIELLIHIIYYINDISYLNKDVLPM